MPRGDGTGPAGGGGGFGGGRGMGRGGGRGTGMGLGPQGSCVCPNCGYSVPHQAGSPCYSIKCPKCGTQMIRG